MAMLLLLHSPAEIERIGFMHPDMGVPLRGDRSSISGSVRCDTGEGGHAGTPVKYRAKYRAKYRI
jgi:hypothetical protein